MRKSAWSLGFYLKISKEDQQRPTILVIFCIRESVALISLMLPMFSQTLTFQEAFDPPPPTDKQRAKQNGI